MDNTRSMTMYKVLGENGACHHGGRGRWHLPVDGKPGRWMPRITGDQIACERGYHLVTLAQLPGWLGPVIWTAEYDGEWLDASDKIVVRRARLLARVEAWNETSARLFAADCAEHVLPLFERKHPDDQRPRQAIEAARAFAHGQITREMLNAAWAAAGDAGDARDARDAAGAAAGAAAWDAARAAAGDAERQWQADRLGQYFRGEVAL